MTQVANCSPVLESPGCLFLDLNLAPNYRETMADENDADPADEEEGCMVHLGQK